MLSVFPPGQHHLARHAKNPTVATRKGQHTHMRNSHKLITAGVAVAALIALACSSGGKNNTANPPVVLDTATPVVQVPAGDTSAAAPPAQTLPPVKGSDSQLVELHATLNGKFKVDYQASSVCIIVDFLKADGTDGGAFMDSVNTCAGDINGTASGSKLVTLNNVTMIQVDNTHGAWTVTLTPLA